MNAIWLTIVFAVVWFLIGMLFIEATVAIQTKPIGCWHWISLILFLAMSALQLIIVYFGIYYLTVIKTCAM